MSADAELDELLGPAGPLDRPITVTRFANAGAKTMKVETTTLRRLAETIRTESAPAKEKLPWLKLAEFGDIRTLKRSLRHDANMVAIEGVEGDYDGGVVGIDEACDLLRAADLAAVVYSTPSHSPAKPRWRVLCPTNGAKAPDEREALCARVNGALGGVLAPESFAKSQAYYFGRIGNAPHHRVELVEGRPIDQASELQAIGRDGAAYSPTTEGDEEDDSWCTPEPDWPRIKAALDSIPTDQRGEREAYWRPIGMALHSASDGDAEGFDAWEAWSKVSPKFSPDGQRKAWDSFGRPGRKVKIGTLFHLAIQHGWNAKEVTPESRLTFLTPDDCAVAPSRGYIVKGMIAPGDVGCIFGAPGSGKSLLSPFLGFMVATGQQAFGMRTHAGPVFYVAAEDPHGMRGRVTALKAVYGAAADFLLVEGVSDLLAAASPDLSALMEATDERRPALTILDTLAMSFPGLEENSADGMGRVVAVARKLSKLGTAVVLIHHDTKAEGSTPRGHSLLNGALDFAVHLQAKGDDGVIRGKLTKNRNGTCVRDIAFRIATRDLGNDEDGDSISVAFAEPLAPGAAPRRERLPAGEAAALDVLQGLWRASAAVNGAGGRAVHESLWRSECETSRRVSAAPKEASRQTAMNRALKGLLEKGRIEARDGWVWPSQRDASEAFDEV